MFHRLFSAMTNGGGRRGLLYLLTLVAATGGVIAIALAIQWQQSAPQPSAAAAGRISSYGPTQPPPSKPQANDSPSEPSPVEPPPTSTAGPVPVARSVPKVLEIPAIGVRSSVIPVGRTPAGTLAVPQPGPDLDKAAWYKNSPTPGQPGPSVIEGHIDSQQGPSVFFELGAMRPGDLI